MNNAGLAMEAPKLGFMPKLWFGVGQAAEGMKNASFNTFLLLYYSQVLGLNPALAGAVLLIALVFDAVTDPLTGSISDTWRGRFGRRHGFMYAATLPMAVTFYFVWSPPAGLGQAGLFGWMLVWTVLARGAMTLYHVPHLALGAELSDDYAERSRVVAYRVFFGFVGAASIFVIARTSLMLPSEAFPEGQLNPAAYPPLGLYFGIAMGVLIFLSAIGTHARIPYLKKPSGGEDRFSLARLWRDVVAALRNPSFQPFFGGIFLFFIARGVDNGLGLYMGTFFWKLGSDAVLLPAVGLFGVLFGTPVFALLAGRMEKKTMFLLGIIGFSLLTMAPPIAKLVAWFPAHSSPVYLTTLYSLAFAASFFAAAPLVTAGSMLADVADEHELDTGRRQEGIFFGALSFSSKSSAGIGSALAGLALWLISFPTQAEVEAIPQATVTWLALIYGPGVLAMVVVSIVWLSRYGLTRARHAEIREMLDERNALALGAEEAPAEEVSSRRTAVTAREKRRWRWRGSRSG